MSKVCSDKFLDVNGNPSSTYYDNLKHGEEYARRMYLEEMSKHAYAMFQQKPLSTEDIIKRGKTLKLTPDGTFYQDKAGNNLTRSTSFIGDAQNKFESEKIAQDLVRSDIAKEILNEDIQLWGVSVREAAEWSKGRIYKLPGMKRAVEKRIAENEGRFNHKVKKYLDLWDFKREAGTEIHEVLEWFVEAREELVPDEDGNLDINLAKEKALEKLEEKGTDGKLEDYAKLIDQIESWVQTLPKGMKFSTEVKIYDEKLGVAGTIDLLAEDANGNVYIFDYKTKEVGKEHLFDMKGDRKLKAPIDHLYDNKETLGALQTSLYRLILERQGKTVRGAEIIYIEAEVKENEQGKLVYADFKKLENNKVLRNYRSDLGKLFALKGIDIDEETKKQIEEGKINNSSDVIFELLGRDDFNEYKDMDSIIFKILDNAEAKGEDFFRNKLKNNRKENFVSEDRKEREKQLREYLTKLKSDKDSLSDSVISYFNKADGKNKKYKNGDPVSANQANNLLKSIHRDTHTLEQVKNFYGFEDTNPNILVAINKLDGSAEIIYVGGVESNNPEFENDEKSTVFDRNKRTTIAGNLISDKGFLQRFGMEGLENTDANYKLIQSGIIAAELMKSGHIKSVNSVKTGVINGYTSRGDSVALPHVKSMRSLLPHIKAISELTKDKQSKYLRNVLTDRKIMSGKTYDTDYRRTLLYRLQSNFDNLDQKLMDELSSNLTSHLNGQMRDAELLQSLIKSNRSMLRTLRQRGVSSYDDLANYEEYILIAKTISQVANVNMSIGSYSKKLALDNKIRITGRIANEAIRALDSKVKSTENAINRDFKNFHNKHSELVKKLIDESSMTSIGSIDMADIFKPMFLVDPDKKITNNTDNENLFNLKSPDAPGLTKTQREYIKFFNEYVLKGYEYVYSEKRMEGLKEGVTWKEGRIPLMLATKENKALRSDSNVYKDLVTSNFTRNVKNTQEKFDELNTRLDNRFVNQAKAGTYGGTARMNMLGIRADGSVSGDPSDLETNLEVVLNSFMQENLRSHYYEETLGVYNAMNMVAYVDNSENFNDTKEVREFMQNYIKLIVFNEHKDEGKGANVVDIAQKTMTGMALGFSAKQVILEGATNTFANVSAMMSQTLLKAVGIEPRFGVGDWTKAYTTISNKNLRKAIVSEFGLYRSDSESFGSADYAETKKRFWFQSKWAYALNNLPFKAFRTQTFVAELHRKGIMPAITHVNGIMKYDPSKDRRFSEIFKDGKLLDKSELTTDKAKDQFAYWESFIEDLYQEGNLDEKGMPKTPLSYKETNAMKHYSMKLYGSVDKDAKVLAQASVFGRMLLKFKNWAVSKKDNWWTATHKNELVGRREKVYHYDEFGNKTDEYYYEFVDGTEAGVIQIIMDLVRGIESVGKTNIAQNFKELDLNQKETLMKGLSDLIMVITLISLLSMLSNADFFDKDERGKALHKILGNATSDLNIFRMSGDLASSNPFAVIGYAMRAGSSAIEVISSTVTGDVNEAGNTLNKLFGITKSLDLIIEE